MIHSASPAWQRSVRLMRWACPIIMTLAVANCAFAFAHERYFLALVSAFLAGVNLVLTWIQYRIFQL